MITCYPSLPEAHCTAPRWLRRDVLRPDFTFHFLLLVQEHAQSRVFILLFVTTYIKDMTYHFNINCFSYSFLFSIVWTVPNTLFTSFYHQYECFMIDLYHINNWSLTFESNTNLEYESLSSEILSIIFVLNFRGSVLSPLDRC